jgi:succinate dehydrogenase/fumarate reductase flavoprotein subunit
MATKVIDCDLVVLGAGGAGLAAAVKASDLTGKKVIVLEKSKKPGGATYFAGGFAEIKDSKWQKDAGYKVSEAQDITGQIFDWFVSKGGAESFYKVAQPEENRKLAIYTAARTEKYKDLPDPSIGPGRGGSFIVDKLVECCRKNGIQIFTETPARKFITDDRGNVTGVLADSKDGQLLINCKACVVAAGGFGSNYAKLKKYWPEYFDNQRIHSLCPPGMMGDGIDMAEEIGAHIAPFKKGMSTPGGFFNDMPMHHPYSWAVHSIMSNGNFVSVNLNGKRWRNEGGMGGSATTASQPGAVAYAVADDEIVETLGSKMASEGLTGPMDTTMDPNSSENRAIRKWREDFEYEAAIDEAGASGNHTKKADTLVELALKMKIDPKTFVETIERYNKFCETGKDLDFGKSAQNLKLIKKPPFWAVYGQRWSQCTKGMMGIAVNSKFEALNNKGEAIPGLYAAGDTCTIYGGLVLTKPMGMGAGGGAPGAAAASGAASQAVTAPGAGPSGGPSGNMPPMFGGSSVKTTDISGEGSPCGGSNAALISGYYAALGVADYFKNS